MLLFCLCAFIIYPVTGNRQYCLCCDEEVPFNVVERNQRTEFTCAYCGFPLDVQQMPEPAKTAETGCILVAEDSAYTRGMIEDLVREKDFSRNVLSFENGLGMISEYSALLSAKRPVEIAIIDLNMPVMDGITAARTMRALEAQNGARQVPIVFFSAEKADDDLRKHMELLQPANYVNKGTALDPDNLKSRVEYLLAYLMEKYHPRPF